MNRNNPKRPPLTHRPIVTASTDLAEFSIPVRAFGPEQAAELLTINTGNRPISNGTVDMYARQMATPGGWTWAGDPIRVAVLPDGTRRLIDGQHRLKAVVKSGATILFAYVEVQDASVQRVVDSGLVRSAAQQLKMEDVKYATTSAAIVRLLMLWGKGVPNGTGKFSRAEIAEFSEQNKDILLASAEHAQTVGYSVPLRKAAIGAVAFRAYTLCERAPNRLVGSDVAAFFEALATGVNLDLDDPIYVLRESANRWQMAKVRKTQLEHLYYLARVWNGHRAGEKFLKLQLPSGPITSTHLTLI